MHPQKKKRQIPSCLDHVRLVAFSLKKSQNCQCCPIDGIDRKNWTCESIIGMDHVAKMWKSLINLLDAFNLNYDLINKNLKPHVSGFCGLWMSVVLVLYANWSIPLESPQQTTATKIYKNLFLTCTMLNPVRFFPHSRPFPLYCGISDFYRKKSETQNTLVSIELALV